MCLIDVINDLINQADNDKHSQCRQVWLTAEHHHAKNSRQSTHTALYTYMLGCLRATSCSSG